MGTGQVGIQPLCGKQKASKRGFERGQSMGYIAAFWRAGILLAASCFSAQGPSGWTLISKLRRLMPGGRSTPLRQAGFGASGGLGGYEALGSGEHGRRTRPPPGYNLLSAPRTSVDLYFFFFFYFISRFLMAAHHCVVVGSPLPETIMELYNTICTMGRNHRTATPANQRGRKRARLGVDQTSTSIVNSVKKSTPPGTAVMIRMWANTCPIMAAPGRWAFVCPSVQYRESASLREFPAKNNSLKPDRGAQMARHRLRKAICPLVPQS